LTEIKKNIICLVLIIIGLNYSETLFEVKDASNNKVLDVSSDGLTVLNNGDTLMVIRPDGIRAYIQADSTKGLSRSFSVTTTQSKGGKGQNKVFEIATDDGAVFYNPADDSDRIFSVNKNSITANVNSSLDRDFTVNDQTIEKLGNNLFRVSNKQSFEAVNDSTMLWYKKKNAFRVGHIYITDDSEVGQASFASGYRTTASGKFSMASGILTESSGYGTTALGIGTLSNAIGATAMGSITRATGYNSLAAGYAVTAQASGSAVFGRFNVVSGTQEQWIDTEPLFVIGNGSSDQDRSNAFTVLKNGKVYISDLYTNVGTAPLKILCVDQSGQLCVNSKEGSSEINSELLNEIEKLRTENTILKSELEKIKKYLNIE